MEQLFKNLPRDLQWEVLVEFVGTHVVHGGILMRKIVYSTNQAGKLLRQVGNTFFPVVDGLRVRERLPWLYDRHDGLNHYIRFYSDSQMKFYEDAVDGETIYCYKKVIDDLPLWEVHFTPSREENAITLPPFIKHTYPSYPFTNKKRLIPL